MRPPPNAALNLLLAAGLALSWARVAPLGCAPDQPAEAETEGRPVWDGAWPVTAGRLVSLDGRLVLQAGGETLPLADALVGAPVTSEDGRALAFCHRGDGASDSVLETARLHPGGALERWVLVAEGSPDRVALDADGDRVAWVNSAGGVASVFVARFPNGAPEQVTNVGIVPVPGEAPIGFVPPPHDGPLRFEGGGLAWSSPDGPQRVALP